MDFAIFKVDREDSSNSVVGGIGLHNVTVFMDETAVEIGEAKEGLNILNFLWNQPI